MKSLIRVLAVLLAPAVGWSYTYIPLSSNPNSLPFKWDPGTVALRILADNTTALSDGLTRATSIQTAAQSWNIVLGNLQFQTQIAAPATAGRNGVNELAFADDVVGTAFGSGVLAITLTRFSGGTRDSDTIFNTKDWTWNSFRGPLSGHNGNQDLLRVAIHELGHTLGLDHPDEAGQSVTAIMNSRVSSSVDALRTDDITGVQNLYGPAPLGSRAANDNFANALAVTLNSSNSATLTGTIVNATKESGEPNHVGNPGGHSVWWKWTAPTGGSVTIDTRGSYADTALAVYTGTALASLTEIASNDDLQNDQDGHIQASRVTFTATSGTTYLIAVDGFDGDTAGVTLNLAFSGVATAPSITTQPLSQTVTAGESASFSVAAAGSGPLTYQWSFGGATLSGATSATLGFVNTQAANAGTYSVTVSNSLGSVTSNNVTLTVNAVIATPVVTNPVPAPSGGGGGGGGGVSAWFVTLLSVLGIGRCIFRSRR